MVFCRFARNIYLLQIMEKANKGKQGTISKKLSKPYTKKNTNSQASKTDDTSPYFDQNKTENVDDLKQESTEKLDEKFSSNKSSESASNKVVTLPDPSGLDKEKHEGEKFNKKAKWEPESWQQVVDNLREMRSKSDAPVDTMGCHKCADETVDEKTKRYHKLVALMLSSQTKDQVTFEAMGRLKEQGLTPQKILKLKTTTLEDLLKPVSFYKNKAKYLQKTAQILIDQYEGDIPNTVEELVKLSGVGPKMAHICMSTAWGVVSGIGVDVHVHRISNRLGWVKKPTKDPEKTRNELESWIPPCYWSEINHLMVGFGQTICTAQSPKCTDCLNKFICPSAKLEKMKQKKK